MNSKYTFDLTDGTIKKILHLDPSYDSSKDEFTIGVMDLNSTDQVFHVYENFLHLHDDFLIYHI